MNIKKQHIVLNLIRSGRYTLDTETGNIISHIGKEARIIQPIKHYTGYLQYNLDIGYNEIVSVYGQGFSYLATWLTTFDPSRVIDHIDKDKSNNKPDNLRCITERMNIEGNFKGCNGRPSGFIRKRLSSDEIHGVIQGHNDGISFVKLAKKYGVTRQTIARICQKKQMLDNLHLS